MPDTSPLPPRAAAIESATGTPFREWAQMLDEAGARAMDHAEIVRTLRAGGRLDSDWWAQSLTVAYEQWIGRRVVGQTCDGAFNASASRTLPLDPDTARDTWDAFLTPQLQELGLSDVRTSDTPRWRYWRANVADGSTLSVNISAKDQGRSVLAITHDRLEDADARDAWKARWAQVLTAFLAHLKETQ
ncbi:hypothetical protein JSY14_04970 [Brachybacterium sp. EF45031]|uniref:hypothetical protein n=1 Tax=Brachybacterium sillae TaxID=2810536 RepID=UPI00217D8294|nr:hypothetical protein [Brachybacterium sillae]MCS6711404.1 hypothetical protein [Brachybacterium sillae]